MIDPAERPPEKEVLWAEFDRMAGYEPNWPGFHRERNYEFTGEEQRVMQIERSERERERRRGGDDDPDLAALLLRAEPYLEEEEIMLLVLLAKGKSHRECAEILGWAKGSVDYRMQRSIVIARAAWNYTKLLTPAVRSSVVGALSGNARIIWWEYVAGVPLIKISRDFEAVHPPGVIGIPGRHHYQFVRSVIRRVGEKFRNVGLGGYVDAAEVLRDALSISGRGHKTRVREVG